MRQQRAAKLAAGAGKQLEGFGHLDGCGKIHRRIQDSGSIAGLDRAVGRFGEDAGETGGFSRHHVHGHGIGTDGGCIYPWPPLFHCVIVDQIACFEVIGAVEDEVRGPEKRMDIRGNEVGDVSVNRDFAVEESNLAPGSLRFGQRVAGIVFVKQHLTLEIALFHEVAINDGKCAHAGAGQ
jgi:hypothetical protein